jgi:hypothetical protein
LTEQDFLTDHEKWNGAMILAAPECGMGQDHPKRCERCGTPMVLELTF